MSPMTSHVAKSDERIVSKNTKMIIAARYRGRKPSYTHTFMQNLNPSTSAKLVMTKLQNVFVALANMNMFHMTLKLSLFTVDYV